MINLAPWIIAILYDFLYYVGRIVWHEVPIWGGRARGERRPRAPSLRDRNRSLSLAGVVGGGGGGGGTSTGTGTGTGWPADATAAAQNKDERDIKSQIHAADAGIGIGSRGLSPRHRQRLSNHHIQVKKDKEQDDT